jgi:hypothetical protein
MSALSKLHIPSESFVRVNDRDLARTRRQNYYQKSATTSQQQIKTVVPNRVENRQTHSRQLQELPANLKLLSIVQKCSFGVTLLSVAASVGLYVANVKTPQNWSQEYKNLETLQRQERQLIEINETLKYQIARQASQQNRRDINATKLENVAVFIPSANIIEAKIDPQAEQNSDLFKKVSLGY